MTKLIYAPWSEDGDAPTVEDYLLTGELTQQDIDELRLPLEFDLDDSSDGDETRRDMTYTHKERQRITLRAKRKVGLVKSDAGDRRIFMEQCMGDMMDSGEASDDGDARDICEMLWNEDLSD